MVLARLLLDDPHQILIVQQLAGDQYRMCNYDFVTRKERDELVWNILVLGESFRELCTNIEFHIFNDRTEYVEEQSCLNVTQAILVRQAEVAEIPR